MISKYVLLLRLRSGSWLPVCHSEDKQALVDYSNIHFNSMQHCIVVENTDKRFRSNIGGLFSV